jgi:glycosyltransferase involved in cell wall biosynthesis
VIEPERMISFFSLFLTILASLLAIPVLVLAVELIASLFCRVRSCEFPSNRTLRKRIAILVPAHNESAGIRSTLESIKPHLVVGDRLLVVADNCTDDTATVAAESGAEVIVRSDYSKVGKGYALDFGIKHLSMNPPEIVIVIDADCKITDHAFDRLATTCAATNRPVQAHYLMNAPHDAQFKFRVAEFAWRVKNWARPLGLLILNLPCHLMGSGMAFPWEVIRSANLAHDAIVEDMKLGLELAQAMAPPLFCPTAKISSHFPSSDEGAASQRMRWEKGHIGMIFADMPRFFAVAISHRNLGLFILTLDLLVPPLSLLVLLVAGMILVAALAAFLGSTTTPLFVSIASLLILTIAISLAWIKYGRDILPFCYLYSIAVYVYSKLPLYRKILSRRTKLRWVRTDRSRPS